MIYRLIIVNIFSIVKRLFFNYPLLYSVIVFLPLLTTINTTTSIKTIRFVFFLILILFSTGNLPFFIDFIPIILLMLFKPSFETYSFDATLSKLVPLYVLLSLYGLYQFVFGFSSFELGWINSNLGVVGVENVITEKNIRPFSTFAGVPEFSFFCATFMYYFYTKNRRAYCLSAFVMLLISGSRGIIISTLIAFFVIHWFKEKKFAYMLKIGFLISLLVFVGLIFIYPLVFQFSYDSASRVLVYGTFNGRIVNWLELLDKASYLNVMFGNFDSVFTGLTVDNLYLNLLLKMGVFGALYFFSFFTSIILNEKSLFFMIIFLGYSFYADVIFSFYFMFPLFFAQYSTK